MLWQLFWTFLEIGAVSFGGGYGMISLIREKVLLHGWLEETRFLSFIAVSESTPGPLAINMATFIGASQAGMAGAVCATLGWVFSPESLASPQMHLLSGATMLGAFFILTDPVTASTTNHGRLIFGALAGLLVWLIRSFGGYPDGVAFAVLLANITVPLIDYYTRPRVYGHR